MENKNNGIGVLSVLGIIFVVLKLVGTITWSWWWVTAPFWGGFLLWIVIIGFLILITAFSDKY